jgi:transcriptional regulator with XRE-family HTH domain
MTSAGTLGKRLRETRIRLGLSQVALGQLCGSAKAKISRYENGHVEPNITTLKQLADSLNVSTHWLLTGEMTPKEDLIELLVSRGVVLRSRRDAQILGALSAEMASDLGMMGMTTIAAD